MIKTQSAKDEVWESLKNPASWVLDSIGRGTWGPVWNVLAKSLRKPVFDVSVKGPIFSFLKDTIGGK